MGPECIHCRLDDKTFGSVRLVGRIVKSGHFWRKSDGAKIQRFFCLNCRQSFSDATNDLCFRQHKRLHNAPVAKLLVSNISIRRTAIILKLNRKTVARKLIFLGAHAKRELIRTNLEKPKSAVIEFDDLETIEHTKLKPVSVTIAVEYRSRRILGLSVAKMPAKGLLVKKSLKKYGRRKDERSKARKELFETIKPMVLEHAIIKSDQNPYYTADVKKYFPNCVHETFRSRRSSVSGQGELKKVIFDPLFSLNHTCAMFRANVARLIRKTWCTTKNVENLHHHLAIYALFHNGFSAKETM